MLMHDAHVALSPTRRRQAALLYHYASPHYLEPLLPRIDQLMVAIDRAQQAGAGRVAPSTARTPRQTAAEWRQQGRQALLEFRGHVARQMSLRAIDVYGASGIDECWHGLGQHWLGWTAPDDEARFKAMFDELSRYCLPMDLTLDRHTAWNDADLALAWRKASRYLKRIPSFELHSEWSADSGQRPPRTGVYAAKDDPHAALQFAWAGDDHGHLLDSSTFNAIGLEALQVIGRDALWLDDDKMCAFIAQSRHQAALKDDSFFDFPVGARFAGGLVARNAFVTRPCRWQYVALIDDQYEVLDPTTDSRWHASRHDTRGPQGAATFGWWRSLARRSVSTFRRHKAL
jgi:hypothetical protein